MTDPSTSTRRLEIFLATVLRADLQRLLQERDDAYNGASQCYHLRQFLADLRDLGTVRQVALDTAPNASVSSELQQLVEKGPELATAGGAAAQETEARSVLHKAVTVSDDLCSSPAPLSLLMDVSGPLTVDAKGQAGPGSFVYTTAVVDNPSIIHVNVGCGVVVPMTHEEAVLFLHKKEKLFRDLSAKLGREALKTRFRIRLVSEAISRLQVQN